MVYYLVNWWLSYICPLITYDNVGLGTDGGLDDGGVEGVGDQGDDNINLLHSGIELSIVANIEGDSLGVLETSSELLGAVEGTASCSMRLLSVTAW